MKLNSLDELFEFLSYKGLKISDLEFSVGGRDTSPTVTEEYKSETTCSSSDNDTAVAPTNVFEGKLLTFNGNPSIPIQESDEDIIYVQDFETVPNSCHMGKINLLNRELYGGICTEGDNSKIDLLIEYNHHGNTITVRKDFKLKKVSENQQEKVLLNITE